MPTVTAQLTYSEIDQLTRSKGPKGKALWIIANTKLPKPHTDPGGWMHCISLSEPGKRHVGGFNLSDSGHIEWFCVCRAGLQGKDCWHHWFRAIVGMLDEIPWKIVLPPIEAVRWTPADDIDLAWLERYERNTGDSWRNAA